MEFRFYFNDIGELFCDIENINSCKTYKGRDALHLLSTMDDISFTQGEIAKNQAILYSSKTTCILVDYHKFYKTRMLDACPYTKKSFNEMIIRFNEKEARRKKKRLRQLKYTARRAMCGLMVAAILGSGVHLTKNIIDSEKKDIPDKPETGFEDSIASNSDITIEDKSFYFSNIQNSSKPSSFDEDIDLNIHTDNYVTDELEKKSDSAQMDNDNKSKDTANTITNEDVYYSTTENQFFSEKGQYAYSNYYETVQKYASKWGISSNIIMSMLTQESGGYVEDNLMQIQFYSWEDQVITVYNFEENKEEKIVLTNNPQKFKKQYDDDIICITESDLKNPSTNISIACVLFRTAYNLMKGHIIAAIQCYNLGCGNMWNVFDEMYAVTGRYPDLDDQDDVEFLNYLYVAIGGDKNYVENVIRFNNSEEPWFIVKNVDDNGNIVENQVYISSSNDVPSLLS